MEFRVLGPLEAIGEDGRPVRLGGQRERALLALLLTRPNQVVSMDALVDGVWGGQPPRSAEKTLQSHVVRLRRTLEPARPRGAPGQVLVTREPGYQLHVAPQALDAARFEQLVRQGRGQLAAGDPRAGAATLRRALSLWRGPAFQEFEDTGFARAEAGRLGELRLGAIEDRVHADLAAGRDRELVAELEGLVSQQPLRERLWAGLLLALYRAGRQADALRAYQRARAMLVEELGIEPSAELRRLEAAILAQDPALDLVPAARQAQEVLELPGPLALAGTPCLGRATELAVLEDAWKQLTRERGGAVFVGGPAGIGKTRLAAELAHQVHEQGALVGYGRCAPPPAPPLQPLAQVLSGVGAQLGELGGAAGDGSAAELGVALAALLQDKAAGRALLVVADELHLADPTVLEALQHLLGAGAAGPLVVLGLYRDDQAAPALGALLESVDPDPGGAWQLRLGPLGAEAVAGIAALYAGEAVAAEVVSGLCRDTGGVPLLVHRAARGWATARASGRLDAAASRGAAGRGQLRAAETEIAEGVVDLQRLRQPPPERAGDRAVVCPYKGLARFEPSDAEFFCGRERLAAELVARLVGAGLLGVVGPSGSGKSSLLRAGLLPALREGVLPGSQRWRQVLMRPGEHPMRELARLLDVGDDGPGMLLRVAAQCTRADGRLLLVVDQFEEVFTACQDPTERASFLDELLAAAGAEQGAVVVVGLRADYYGRCAEHAGLAAQLGASQVLVGPMRPGELRRAIELPAERAGLRVEPALTQAMVADVAGEPGGLPLLSTALLEGWERRQGRTLTLVGYYERGGVHGAVARLAERAWLTLGPQEQAAARRILLRLAGPGEGAAVTRRRVALAELEPKRDQHTARALQVLTARRLLTASEATVEVAHEALLREWPRLRGWLEDDVQGRALHRHVIGAAQEWEAAGRDPGELYRGARLTGALDWARDHHADLNEVERDFLDASRAAAEREVADARRRAEHEARSSRRLRMLLVGLAGVLALALAAGTLATVQRGRAQDAARIADARRLGAQALVEGDLDRSLLLAAEAVRLDDSVDTRGALLTSLLRSPEAVRVLRGGGNRLQELAVSPDGRTLAAVDNMGFVYLWDTRTGRRVGGPFGPNQGNFNVPVFSPDGRILATGGAVENGGLVLWDVASRTISRRLASKDDIASAAFSPNGSILAAGTVHGSLLFWKAATGEQLGPVLHSHHPPEQGQGPGVSLAFAHRSATLYTSAQDGKTIVWDVAHRRPVRTLPIGGNLAVSPNGKTLALGQQDGSISLADAATGQRLKVLTGHTAAVARLAFSPDGATLASVSDDRTAIVWDVATREARETLHGHAGWVHGVAFSPDGRTLYTSSLDDSVIAWDLTRTRGLARQLTGAAGHVTGVAFSPRDRNLLALVRDDGPATLWDTARRAQVGELPVSGGFVNTVAFSPNGGLLAAENHTDGNVVLFDVATRTRVGQPLHPPYHGPFVPRYSSRDVNAMAFSPDGKLLATAGNDGAMVLWDLATHAPIGRPLRPHPGFTVNAVAFSPDGRMLASGIDDGTVLLTRVPDGTMMHKLTVTEGPSTTALAFSPDGTTLATGAVNGKVRLWDPRTGAARRTWVAQAGFVLSTVYSPDGTVLATSGTDGTAALWDVRSAKQIGTPLNGPSQRWGMAVFDATGHTLATALQDGTVLLWNVDPRSWLERACAVAGRDLTSQEWAEFLPGRPYQPPCGTP
jgi:WD40 repeat protein/DNA-binding SARP family transcriptional activator